MTKPQNPKVCKEKDEEVSIIAVKIFVRIFLI
jgi:hypothetical protein